MLLVNAKQQRPSAALNPVVRSIVEPLATLMASDNFTVVEEIEETAVEILVVSGAVPIAEPAEVALRSEVGEAMAVLSLDEVRQESALKLTIKRANLE